MEVWKHRYYKMCLKVVNCPIDDLLATTEAPCVSDTPLLSELSLNDGSYRTRSTAKQRVETWCGT